VPLEQLAEGVEEYVKHGTPFAKNMFILIHMNLVERAAMYCSYKMKKQLGSTLPGFLLPMLRSGKYMPLVSWVSPLRQAGMEYTRDVTLWKCIMQPNDVNIDDVTQICFEHTNPKSRFVNLGQQRLATELNNAQGGAEFDYAIPRTALLYNFSFYTVIAMNFLLPNAVYK